MNVAAHKAFEYVTEEIKFSLAAMNIQPETYKFMFPAGKDAETIRKLVADGFFPTIPHLAPAFTYALLLCIIRLILQVVVLKPLALRAMKLSFAPIPAEAAVIEKSFPSSSSKKKYNDDEIHQICKSSQLKFEAVQRYLWSRKRNDFVSRKVSKFMEAFWRFLMYGVFCVIGYYTLFVPTVAPWILDTNQHWDQWPSHRITAQVEFYYHVQLGAYLHQLLWTEVTRSDAVEMILHHLTTILLLVFSFITNHTRVGSSILLLHDSSDVFLESAKVFNYTSKAKGHDWAKICCDIFFACFAVTFLVTRLVIFPRYIIFSVFFEAPNHFGTEWAGFWFFCMLLVILQILHIFWFYLIAKMIYRLLSTGIEKDERSDDDEDIGEDCPPGSGKGNGKGSVAESSNSGSKKGN